MHDKTNNYFTKIVDEAIVKYKLSSSKKEKEEIFRKVLEPSFRQLIEKVVFAYNFTGLKDLADLKDDCFVALISALEGFDPTLGSKAFSYFTVITKNWFILKFKEQLKRKELAEKLSKYNDVKSQNFENFEDLILKKEFFDSLIVEMGKWESTNEKMTTVINALITIMKDIDKIDFANKGFIFLSLKEITRLKTSELTYLMKKIIKKYMEYKAFWINERENV